MRLHRDDYAVCCRQRIDGQHPQRRHTVDDDAVVVLPIAGKHLLQDGFAAHCIHQRHLRSRQRDVSRQQVNSLRMMQYALARRNRDIVHDLGHQVCDCGRKLIRLLIAEADGHAGLRVSVHQQHLFSFPCHRCPYVDAAGRFRYPSFLIYSRKHRGIHPLPPSCTRSSVAAELPCPPLLFDGGFSL